MSTPAWRAAWAAVGAAFLLGLLARAPILARRPVEGDERVYAALVDQLRAGKGYTLRGHPILERPWLPRDVYDRPVFHHPPGGIVLFWALESALGDAGRAAAQLLGFALFFAGVLLLARELDLSPSAFALAGVLAAVTPLAAFTGCWFWLDGPMAGLATLAAGVFVRGTRSGRLGPALAAGALLGAAAWVRTLALLAAPGAIAVAAATAGPAGRRGLARQALAFAGTAAALHAPWLLWHAWSGGEGPALPLLHSAGANEYLRSVQERRAWDYLTLLPRAMPSLVFSALAWPFLRPGAAFRRAAAALWGWIGAVVLLHVALGAFGFLTLLRYVILAVPAAALLAAAAVSAAWGPGGRALPRALTAAGAAVEIALGLRVLFDAHYRNVTFFSAF
ncbi:MAG: hypothetical protein HY553_06455 [Elusimicrobia bacterium]|nr:hypothetical protein [Elusimicrobiota bacterium]